MLGIQSQILLGNGFKGFKTNKVVTIVTVSKVICGDIPESGFVGHGVSFSWREPGPRLLASMMTTSPLARVEAITAPVLLAVSKSRDDNNLCVSGCHFVCL